MRPIHLARVSPISPSRCRWDTSTTDQSPLGISKFKPPRLPGRNTNRPEPNEPNNPPPVPPSWSKGSTQGRDCGDPSYRSPTLWFGSILRGRWIPLRSSHKIFKAHDTQDPRLHLTRLRSPVREWDDGARHDVRGFLEAASRFCITNSTHGLSGFLEFLEGNEEFGSRAGG